MTSASLSLSNKISNHKKYITRTLWTSVIGYMVMLIYYCLGVITMISRSINYAKINDQSSQVLFHEKLGAVTRVMGIEQYGWVIVVIVAIAFAFQGFSYVFDQRKIDFYLSQPTTRAGRIRKNYFNAITTFMVMYISANAIALFIAALMGAVNSVVIVNVLIEALRSFVLFFTIYNVTVLAILLCGSLPIAMLVLAFLLVVSIIFGYELMTYKEIFYATYYANGHMGLVGSPLYDRYISMFILDRVRGFGDYNLTFECLFDFYGRIALYDIDTLAVGVISFIFVIIFGRFRKAEHAGKTIVYRPFRWILKILSCIVIGLGSAYVFYTMNEYVLRNSRLYILMFVVMIAATILSGCIIETILEGNIRRFFKGKAQTIMAVAIASLIFVIYKGDLTGFDSYIPSSDQVESCAMLYDDYDFQLYVDYENIYEDASEQCMFITDIENFNKLVKEGMKIQRALAKSEREGNYSDMGWSESVVYRMKNGKEVYRRICIPYDFDKKTLSAIIDSDEYKHGCFRVFNDEELRSFDESSRKNATVSYISPTNDLYTKELPYSEISDAYRKDIEEHFSFDLVSSNMPVGRIDYDCSDYSSWASCSLNVYDCYDNTISLLKKYGIYSDCEPDIDLIDKIDVTNYYPGFDLETDDENEIDRNVDSKTITYTDKDQIRDIIESAVSSEFYSRWYRSSLFTNDQFSIIVDYISNSHSNSKYYLFETGKVPAFVMTDTN